MLDESTPCVSVDIVVVVYAITTNITAFVTGAVVAAVNVAALDVLLSSVVVISVSTMLVVGSSPIFLPHVNSNTTSHQQHNLPSLLTVIASAGMLMLHTVAARQYALLQQVDVDQSGSGQCPVMDIIAAVPLPFCRSSNNILRQQS